MLTVATLIDPLLKQHIAATTAVPDLLASRPDVNGAYDGESSSAVRVGGRASSPMGCEIVAGDRRPEVSLPLPRTSAMAPEVGIKPKITDAERQPLRAPLG